MSRQGMPQRVYVTHHTAEEPSKVGELLSGLMSLADGWYVVQQGGCRIQLSEPFPSEAEAVAEMRVPHTSCGGHEHETQRT